MKIDIQCWNCGHFYDVGREECDACGEPWNGFLPEPTGTAECHFCGEPTPYWSDPDDPIVCSACIKRLVDGADMSQYAEARS